jgi:hypothetical protein
MVFAEAYADMNKAQIMQAKYIRNLVEGCKKHQQKGGLQKHLRGPTAKKTGLSYSGFGR